METKLYRLNIEVGDQRLQMILDSLSDRRCTKPFVVAALQEFMGSYKGQHFFEMLTSKEFPFEKKRRAGRIAGKTTATPEIKGHTHVPSVKHSPQSSGKGVGVVKDSSKVFPVEGKRHIQSNDSAVGLMSVRPKQTP